MQVEIEGYGGKYTVNPEGEVFSHWSRTPKKLKLQENGTGYYIVYLYSGTIRKTELIHRLVATAFIPKVCGKDQVNHIDSNRRNNSIANLEWCTPRENNLHGRDKGNIQQKGSKSVKAKLHERDVVAIRIAHKEDGLSPKALAKIFSVSESNIQMIVKRRTWKHI